MRHRLFQAFGRKPSNGVGEGSDSPAPTPTPAPVEVSGGPRPTVQNSDQALAAMELSQELLRGVEHFVLSTPALDTPGFLERLRRTAAKLCPGINTEELEGQRRWAAESLSAFGQLQRRYLSERESELWRLLNLYQDHQKVDHAANKQFHEAIRGTHERIGNIVRLDDLRQVRERLESEINRAANLLEQKSQADEDRAAGLSAQVMQLEAALVAARHEAMRDAMTGVYHRGGFHTQLEAALKSPIPCSLAMIDVDNFKGINDTLGHLVGDHILKTAVQLLGKIARPGDVLGRFGGDEFCLLAPGTPANRLADRFESVTGSRTLNMKFDGRLCSAKLSFSVGVAGSITGDTIESITQRADDALYEAKRSGKARTCTARSPETVAA
ncbi:MAG: GGDEF domain-containing protein [Actinomycetota bacterium]